MLTRLRANDFMPLWPQIKLGMRTALDREVLEHEESEERILKKLLQGRLVCWISRQRIDGPISGIIMTAIIEDDIIASRSLLIFMLSMLGQKPNAKEWMEGFDAIGRYAKSVKCRRILFYSRNPKFIKAMRMMEPKAITDYTMIVIDL